MSFLSKIFKKNVPKESVSERIIKILGCKCEIISPTKDTNTLFWKYQSAYKCGFDEGFVPVFIVADEKVVESIEYNVEDSGKSPEEYRQSLLLVNHDNGSEFLKKRFEEYFTEFTEDFSAESLYGEFSHGEVLNSFTTSWVEYGYFSKTIKMVYAEIPVKNPWEIFAWIPVGGWNECPEPEDIMSVSKLWYEKYGAVPAVITGDTIEYILPVPVADCDEALKTAEQHFAFCPDSVSQGAGSIKCLADSISKSKVWFFWWD